MFRAERIIDSDEKPDPNDPDLIDDVEDDLDTDDDIDDEDVDEEAEGSER